MSIVEKVMSNSACRFAEECTRGDFLAQPDALNTPAEKTEPKFDKSGRQLVQWLAFEPNIPMLEHTLQTECTDTAVPLKTRKELSKVH